MLYTLLDPQKKMNRQNAWLNGLNSQGAQSRWALNKPIFIIGRYEPADIVMPSPRISRQHVAIEQRDFGYHIRDMGSRNGTFVNGKPLGSEAHKLITGDEIVVAGILVLQFEDPEETAQGPQIGRLRGLWIDSETNNVWVDAELVTPPFSPAQLTLLRLLYTHSRKIISRQTIVENVWPNVDPRGVSGEAVDGLIKRLRRRMRKVQPKHEYIRVIRGHGLQFVQIDN